MIKQLFTSAVLAGLVAGIFAAALQLILVVPLMIEGETFEQGLVLHFTLSENGAIETPVGHPSIMAQLPRHFGTLAMNMVAYTGFAFLLVVGFGIAQRAGHKIDGRAGLVWGLAGFIAVHLAPSVGLSPELPGTITADLVARQTWWLGTVLATIAGIASIAFVRAPWGAVTGIALFVAPHVIGAPTIDTYYGVAPPELASQFAARALAVAAASWAVLGAAAGWLWCRSA
ncbi:MAG: CbtA family protein [Octadecabacter sp.]